ncbi:MULTISPECIES: PQQ-binding-like beta-propeller repeat protein [Bacteroides]|uniref:outer membrane protein assembly factor BamB family protein n=1 Tax=Bacteroides TaxID=816 RepID=UPI0013EB0523|nr:MULTISPECIES: PQQ-binding-like beta-propeller repeat protein [Bacteroides]MBC5614512.1 PQQ-binding-like beta-propeller repeat protein [Bacteroides hominis (ex Liu et al. 2022)]MCS2830938.1 PQQ-binding-like beta-propeller repeat protein [Bacteroides fragilis]QTO26414.1 PQQ-binding-like beta-propeller repeat protein [Bacteroides sp. ZJ-18]
MKKNILFLLLLAATTSATAAYNGRVFVDKNSNGQFDRGEKTLGGIKVSDGLNVTETAKDGTYTLPGHARQRFIFITTPSGYKTLNKHYHKIDSRTNGYDFGLLTYHPGIGKDGSHQYVHVSDTEIFNTEGNEAWVKNIREYAANENAAFIIHTGDICYENGMKKHIKLMNTENMNVPVFYCIGNHDLVKGKYGEEVFENNYGPVYYSFDVANVHYIVTPMPGGDHKPGYTRLDVCRWLKNDLAHIKPGTPIVVFNHDILTYGDEFIYKGSETESIDLNKHNLKAWVYGHWHINHVKKQGSVYTVCTSALDKGGIDHSTSAFRIMHVDGKGDFSSELRYSYLNNSICIASPAGHTASPEVTVNVYSSASPVRRVTYTCLDQDKPVLRGKRLSQSSDWCWTATLPLKETHAGKELTIQVEAEFKNGETARSEKNFVYLPQQADIRLTENWDNLLGNATHTAKAAAALDSIPGLAWVKNIGANIYMTSPLIHNGNIYTASVDEDLKGRAHIYALDGKNGEIKWKYPVKSSVKNTIAIDNGLVFAQDVLGNLYAVDCESGKLCWESKLPVNGLPALIDGLVACDGVVYAGTGKALSAFEARTGKRIWKNEGWSQREGTTSTLTQGNGILIGSVQWSALYGNDSKTGKMLWSVSNHGLRNRGASAAMHGSLLYLISEKSFFILEAATGRIIVRKPLPYNLDATSTPLLTDKEIIFGTANKGLVALDNETLEEKWNCPIGDALIYTAPYSRPTSGTIETSPALAGKTVYVGASDGGIYGIDKRTGKIVWKYTTGAPIFSSVAISGNTLIATDFGGNVYAFSTIKK